MAGHRDDGTFAEDRRNHPKRRVSQPFSIFDDEALKAVAQEQAAYWAQKGISMSDMGDLQERAEHEGWDD